MIDRNAQYRIGNSPEVVKIIGRVPGGGLLRVQKESSGQTLEINPNYLRKV